MSKNMVLYHYHCFDLIYSSVKCPYDIVFQLVNMTLPMCSHFHLIFLEYRVALNTHIFADLFMISNAYLLDILRWGRYLKCRTNIICRILRKNRLKFLAILYSFCSWTKMTNVFFLTKFGLQRIVFF